MTPDDRYDAPDPWWFAWLLWPAAAVAAAVFSYFSPFWITP